MERFAERLLEWFDRHGRHDLPWQHKTTPYSVWVSEVMLQQTQVLTVIPYYQRFMARFTDIRALADASQDEVLALWSGLGYYSRARNLHRAARQICDEHGGEFPRQFDEVLALPGIGRSTAGAILAIAHGQHHPILDGNVKRVLSRYHAIEGWPGRREVEQQLWQLATKHTPKRRVADYTQSIMDLGATLCTRSRPDCGSCPMQEDCVAYRQQRIEAFPGRKPRRTMPTKEVVMPVVINGNSEVLLEKRAPSGIWGGLWSLPECSNDAEFEKWCVQMGADATTAESLQAFRHTFSHYHLMIQSRLVKVAGNAGQVAEGANLAWQPLAGLAQLGLPSPVRKLLARVAAG